MWETDPLWETVYERNKCCFDVGVNYISQNISKRSRVRIEVWDYDKGDYLGPADDWTFTREGTIANFLRNGHRDGVGDLQGNFINTISFWQDVYKEVEYKIKKTKKIKGEKRKSKKNKNKNKKEKGEKDIKENDK